MSVLSFAWMKMKSTCLQVLYAVALIPIGLLADKVNRPRLLAGGLLMWSLLTMTGSKVKPLNHLVFDASDFQKDS